MNEAELSPPFAAPHTQTEERNMWLTRNCNIRAALLGWRLHAAPPSKKMDMQKVVHCGGVERLTCLREGRQAFSQLNQTPLIGSGIRELRGEDRVIFLHDRAS